MVVVNTDLPPLINDPNIPVNVPAEAPSSNYFVLIIRNRGLPAGFAANTTIHTAFRNNPSQATDTSDISVPFDGQYNLPVLGGPQLDQQLQYSIVTNIVQTNQGNFIAQSSIPVIIPIEAQLKQFQIEWIPVQQITSVTPPIILPDLDILPKTTIVFEEPAAGVLTASFVASTAPPPIPPSTLAPATLTTVLLGTPPSSSLASSVSQMFDVAPIDASSRSIQFNVGVDPSTFIPVTYFIRNNTVTNNLSVSASVPSFLKATPQTFTISPLLIGSCSIQLNVNSITTNSKAGSGNFTGSVHFDVAPLSITGPIYVAQNLIAMPNPNNPPLVQKLTSSMDIPDSPSFTNLLFELTVSNPRLFANEHAFIQLNGSIGSGSVAPSQWSKHLLFGANSITWSSSNPSVIDAFSFNGNSLAILKAGISGSATVTATITTAPLNLSLVRWLVLYNTAGALTGSASPVSGSVQFQISQTVNVF